MNCIQSDNVFALLQNSLDNRGYRASTQTSAFARYILEYLSSTFCVPPEVIAHEGHTAKSLWDQFLESIIVANLNPSQPEDYLDIMEDAHHIFDEHQERAHILTYGDDIILFQ